jgi:hypothetical protein
MSGEKHVHYLDNGLGYEVYGPPTPACDPTKCEGAPTPEETHHAG